MNDEKRIFQLEQQLSSFQEGERKAALDQLSHTLKEKNEEGENVNMHFHSFYSFNAEFWSPQRIAWEAKKASLYAAGIIDFDVLTGLNEYFEAGEQLGIRTSVGIETRAFLNEYANKEIDSPGEPGVSYIAGAGFYQMPKKGSPQALELHDYAQQASLRNKALIERINVHVSAIALDYSEVLPLTPSGSATERHIITAYINKAEQVFETSNELIGFWSTTLNVDEQEAEALIANRFKFEDVVRSKFAKSGGFGYVQPSSDTFPPVEDFFRFVKSCGAIPMESWLDGTSPGEKDGKALLELSQSKGAAALNLIPDRNWNIADAKVKAIKTNNLKNIIATAVSMDMPIHIGTEMNKKGLPFVDDLTGADLNPYKEIFLNGARLVVGHTLLGRFADFSYTGEKAESEFHNLKKRNTFFASVGALPPVDSTLANALRNAGVEKSYTIIKDSVKQGNWVL